ncbi:MAG: hypothetical protein GWO07_05440 [Candidatus Dadabacteria bacterium]|nr:hypothetical protein [Candidatus Dadabacteria bacterium]NIS08201.1 hypothetical protein [Candidatus Dadabacteria bacterium]NIV41447.1 hypothetical protein [Candidatus Dadabacteria bacterium]NIY21691.1 hypothetical protein [Candidatus Dadabacteria bacterium]
MIKFTLALVNLLILTSFLNLAALGYLSEVKQSATISNKNLVNGSYIISSGKSQYRLSQLTENKSFYIELSYNSDVSNVLTKDILSRALREMTTIFIGSGFTYVAKEKADFIAKVYIDAEISDYERADAKKYDFLSKVTIKLYEKDDNLNRQTNKNVFLSGENLEQLAVDSISKSSTLAAKDIVLSLDKETAQENQNQVAAVAPTLKIELLFEGGANYKFFETVNNIVIRESLSEIKVLKRTIKYGQSFSLLVLSKLGSQKLAELIIDRVPDKDSLEVINVSDNRVVFKMN